MSDHVEASLGLLLSSPAAGKVLGLGKRPPRSPGWFVFKDMQPPSTSALIRHSRPLCPQEGVLWRGPCLPLWVLGALPGRPGPESAGEAGVGVHSYQVWRGGLGLRSVIIHVQIDQDFGCSPYSAGHFPYRQLPASRGRGDRDKARPVSTEKETRNRLEVGKGVTCKQHPVSCDRQTGRGGPQALCRWSEGQKRNPVTPGEPGDW